MQKNPTKSVLPTKSKIPLPKIVTINIINPKRKIN